MELYLSRIAQKIYNVAMEENNHLLRLSKNPLNPNLGLFHMPELAFAYQCGKEIMLNANEIFGENIPRWGREVKIDTGGPTDLVFTFNDGRKIAIEFKMRDTEDAYISDIDKLSNIKDHNVLRVFCIVVDVFAKDLLIVNNKLINVKDGRVLTIQNDSRTKKLLLKRFYTNQTWYKSDVNVLVGVWKIEVERDL